MTKRYPAGKILAAAALTLSLGLLPVAGAAPAGQKVSAAVAEPDHGPDYLKIARAYADYMIAHGRDTYGKVHSPVFVSVMDRKTGKVFTSKGQVPYPHVKTKPYAPGLRRDHKMRPYDRHYTGANPLEDLALYKLLYRLTELTGEKRYAAEADKAIRWFLANTQSPATGLYPWGSHMHWNVHADKPVYNSGRYGGHEYNFVWPYWQHNPEALRRFAHGLWDHQIADKSSGRFSRHATYEKHGVGTGYEFPQTAACYMDIWARELARSGDAEMKRAIRTLLKLYRSMRDPKTGAMSWCTAAGADRREVSSVQMNLFMATTLQDAAALVEGREAALAAEMRNFALQIDDEYLSHDPDKVLDVAGKGILTWYTIADRRPMAKGFTPPPDGIDDASVGYPLRTADGKPAASLYYLMPWFVNRSYAGAALLMLERYRRCADKHKAVYRRAILETADIYMTIEPEVQFVVYPDDIAEVVKLLRAVYAMTEKVMYLHRADHMMRLGVRLFFDEVCPLPKISSFDDWYESSAKNGSSMEIFRQMVALARDLTALPADQRAAPAVAMRPKWDVPACPSAGEYTREKFQADLRAAAAKGLAGAWDPAGLQRPSPDVVLRYGKAGARKGLYLSRTERTFGAKSPQALAFEIALSDVINKIPTTAEADRVSGGRMTRFTGKEMTRSNIEYAGFKDVTVACGVVLRNASAARRRVELTVTLHDTYHDNGTRTVAGAIGPNERLLLAVHAPPRRYIRKLRLRSVEGGRPLTIDSLAVILARRNELGGTK
ncbi:MAG: hypothetical protein AMK72_13560 [Planctomycetes bacterium SM23_25]|nr:MAG: hypothetical protein AMK72_13560 [Planctomycetes bacterium SM23_25]